MPLRLTLAIIFVATALVHSALAQGSAVYVVTYAEVMPNAATKGIALLQAYRDASRKEDGNLRLDPMYGPAVRCKRTLMSWR